MIRACLNFLINLILPKVYRRRPSPDEVPFPTETKVVEEAVLVGINSHPKADYFYKFSDQSGREYFVLDDDDHFEINLFFGDPVDRDFLYAASIGLKVGLRYIEYKGKNLVTSVWFSKAHKLYIERERQDRGFPF